MKRLPSESNKFCKKHFLVSSDKFRIIPVPNGLEFTGVFFNVTKVGRDYFLALIFRHVPVIDFSTAGS